MPAISIIIATKNRREVLIRNLRRLHECTFKDLEVIVVDDGSIDGTTEAVSRFSPPPRMVRIENSVGPGMARNAGVRIARGKYLFFMDDDAYVEPRAFEKMVRSLEADPEAATVTFRISCLATGEVNTRHYTYPYCKSLWTIATGIRADAFRMVGGFTDITSFHGEEYHLAVRLTDAGYRLRYAPDIQAYDERAGYHKGFPVERLVNVGYWILIFFDLFPIRRALLFSLRAAVSFGVRSAKERSVFPYLRGLWTACRNLIKVLRSRKLVSRQTVAIYSDPDYLPNTFNVPITRKAVANVRTFFLHLMGRRLSQTS